MATSTQSFQARFEQAMLADAAYADLTGVAPGSGGKPAMKLALLKRGFGDAAATYLSERFAVLDQPEDQSGYSATLLSRRDGSSEPTDDFTFAVRGTLGTTGLSAGEIAADAFDDIFLADFLGIFLRGKASLLISCPI